MSTQAGERHTATDDVGSSGLDKGNMFRNDNGTGDGDGGDAFDDQRSEASTSISEYSSSSASYSQHTARSAEKRKPKEKRKNERRRNVGREKNGDGSQQLDSSRFGRRPLSPIEDRTVKKRVAKYVEMGEESTEQMTRQDNHQTRPRHFSRGEMAKQRQQDKSMSSTGDVADQNKYTVQFEPAAEQQQEERDIRYSVQRKKHHPHQDQLRQKQRYAQFFGHMSQYTFTNLPQSGFASGRGDPHKPGTGVLLLENHQAPSRPHKATPTTGKLNVNAQSFTPSSPVRTILKVEKVKGLEL